MTDAELMSRLKSLLQGIVQEEIKNGPSENLFAMGLLDSMLLVRLVALVERTFDISITEDDGDIVQNFLSFERMTSLVQRKLQEKAG